MTRTKSAIIIFVVIAGAIITALKIDYTDTYVADRFDRALESGQYDDNQPFSLDAFLEFYDWDKVCVALPGAKTDFKKRSKLPYQLQFEDQNHWTLVLIKEYYVVAEIPFDRDRLEAPEHLQDTCFDRWKAIVKIVDKGGVPKLSFVAE